MAYTQAGIAVKNQQAFEAVKSVIDAALAPEAVSGFLRRLEKRGVRVREFEAALEKKVLQSPQAIAAYAELDAADQGQIREYYLAKIEQVDGKVRQRFYKLYAYY